MRDPGRMHIVLLSTIAVILAIAALRASWIVTMPLTLAVFVAVLLWPLQRRLEARLPHWASVSIVTLVLLSVLALAGAAIWYTIAQITEKGPQYSGKIQAQIQTALQWLQDRGLPMTWEKLTSEPPPEVAFTWVSGYAASIWPAFGAIALVIFLVVLLSIEIGQWQRKPREAFTTETSRRVIQTAATIVDQLQWYLLVRTFMSVLAGVVTWLWCVLLRIDFAVIWGLLAFLLNYLPNIGSIISYLPPTFFALVQYDWKWALLTLACIGISDSILGNVIDPIVQGRTLRLSPFVVLVAVVFWGWVWGIAGAILGVPITASLAIICHNVEGLKPIGKLLGSTRSATVLPQK